MRKIFESISKIGKSIASNSLLLVIFVGVLSTILIVVPILLLWIIFIAALGLAFLASKSNRNNW